MNMIAANALAIDIFNHIADGEDGTLDTSGADLPVGGYFVGGVGNPLVFNGFEEANASGALRRLASFLEAQSAPYVGWWTDSDTGKVYVDGTDWYEGEFEAGKAARTRGEIAFWDIARERELRIAYVEGERS